MANDSERPSSVREMGERPSDPGPRMSDPDLRPSSQPTKYEEMPGGEGRGIFFRPDRISQHGLGTMHMVLTVRHDGRDVPCVLHDLSQSGVALLWPDGQPEPSPGEVLDELCLIFEGHETYRGAVEVVGVRSVPAGRVVGVRLRDGMMDVDDVLMIRKVHELKAEGRLDFSAARRPWSRPGFDRFKALVGEMRLFLEDARERFAHVEKELPWRVVHGDADDGGRSSLIRSIREEFLPEFGRLALDIDAASRGASADGHESMKAFSQRLLDDLLLEAPFVQRARFKPFGYPGDFEVMRYIYEHTFEGSSLYARSVHMATATQPGALCVVNRKELLRDQLMGLIRSRRGSEPLRIASVAAGPAQETLEILQLLKRSPRAVEFVLFEQDRRALQVAHGRLVPAADAVPGGLARVAFRHDTIKRLLSDPQVFAQEGSFDAIICAGLFDYLKKPAAERLCGSLYQSVRPGGSLYVGNVTPELPSRWLMEQHMDWYLEYRTRDDLRDMARAGAPGAQIEILEERQGFNPFVKITRPR